MGSPHGSEKCFVRQESHSRDCRENERKKNKLARKVEYSLKEFDIKKKGRRLPW